MGGMLPNGAPGGPSQPFVPPPLHGGVKGPFHGAPPVEHAPIFGGRPAPMMGNGGEGAPLPIHNGPPMAPPPATHGHANEQSHYAHGELSKGRNLMDILQELGLHGGR